MSYPSYGIHEGLSFAQYRADDITQADTIQTVAGKAVSKSLMIDFSDDAKAWKQSIRKKQSAAMKSGSLFDCILTTPEAFDEQYIVSPYDDFRTGAAKDWRAEQEAAGMSVIKQSELDMAGEQLAAVMSHPGAAKLIHGSRKQVAFRHKTAYPFDAKGLIDIAPDCGDMLVDIKTCQSSALESGWALSRYIFDWGYHIQAGAYCQGWSEASGEEVFKFKFIFITSAPPFRVAVIDLPLAAILFGAGQYNDSMKRFAECLERDEWPGMWDNEVTLDIPPHAYSDGGGV